MPLNTVTPSLLYQGLLTASEADLFTVPSGERWVARQIEATNTDAAARAITLKHVPSGGSSGDEHIIAFGKAGPIEATPMVVRAMGQWSFAAGDKMRGFADAASVIALRVEGIKILE